MFRYGFHRAAHVELGRLNEVHVNERGVGRHRVDFEPVADHAASERNGGDRSPLLFGGIPQIVRSAFWGKPRDRGRRTDYPATELGARHGDNDVRRGLDCRARADHKFIAVNRVKHKPSISGPHARTGRGDRYLTDLIRVRETVGVILFDSDFPSRVAKSISISHLFLPLLPEIRSAPQQPFPGAPSRFCGGR